MDYKVVDGDLLDQQVEVIVNPWNRNFLPWWLLLPQGVSGAIKRKAGLDPFWELTRKPMISPGGAVVTSAGRLPYKAIIHVAGINLVWRSSEKIISSSVSNALKLAEDLGASTMAVPLIGAGSGGFNAQRAEAVITKTLGTAQSEVRVIVVRYQKPKRTYTH